MATKQTPEQLKAAQLKKVQALLAVKHPKTSLNPLFPYVVIPFPTGSLLKATG